MKRLLLAFTLLLLFAFAGTSSALAQNGKAQPTIPVTAPDGWENVTDPNEISDTRVYIFTHPDSENRIEVFKRPLVNTAHAATLFTAFHNQLVESKFQLVNVVKDSSHDLKNGKKLVGTLYEYEYSYEDIGISIVAFAFVLGQQAYIIVGYLTPIAKTDGREDFLNLIRSLDISPDD